MCRRGGQVRGSLHTDDLFDEIGAGHLDRITVVALRGPSKRLERDLRVRHGVVKPGLRHDGKRVLHTTFRQVLAKLAQRLQGRGGDAQQHRVFDRPRRSDSEPLGVATHLGLLARLGDDSAPLILRAERALRRLRVRHAFVRRNAVIRRTIRRVVGTFFVFGGVPHLAVVVASRADTEDQQLQASRGFVRRIRLGDQRPFVSATNRPHLAFDGQDRETAGAKVCDVAGDARLQRRGEVSRKAGRGVKSDDFVHCVISLLDGRFVLGQRAREGVRFSEKQRNNLQRIAAVLALSGLRQSVAEYTRQRFDTLHRVAPGFADKHSDVHDKRGGTCSVSGLGFSLHQLLLLKLTAIVSVQLSPGGRSLCAFLNSATASLLAA